MGSVLLLETDETLRQQLLLGLRAQGIDADGLDGLSGLRRVLEADGAAAPEVVVVGAEVATIGDVVGATALRERGSDGDRSPGAGMDRSRDRLVGAAAVIALIDGVSEPLAAGLRAMQDGAADFVLASGGAEGIALAIRKARARRRAAASSMRHSGQALPGNAAPQAGAAPPAGAAGGPVLVGGTPKLAKVLSLVRRLAAVRTAVLVGGESGTGKELIARALHDQSPWRSGPFVAVNCGAIATGLIESELFGHVRGAFTDAVRDKQGLFQAAHGGTLFLDEIADLPLALQPKLLRALQEGVVRRVGDGADTTVEVRVVAATARELTTEVAAHRFREDLYYRIAGVTIQIPALRERTADIPLLAEYFLGRARARLGVTVREIEPEALDLLTRYPWPGNVRELENTIERAAVLCADGRIDVASLPERMLQQMEAASDRAALREPAPIGGGDPRADAEQGALSIKEAARRSEQDLIRRALTVTGGNRTKAAELLEISHRALLYKIKEYNILVPRGGTVEEKR